MKKRVWPIQSTEGPRIQPGDPQHRVIAAKNTAEWCKNFSLDAQCDYWERVNKFLEKRGWRRDSNSGEPMKVGVELDSGDGAKLDLEANVHYRLASARDLITPEFYTAHEKRIAMAAYNAGFIQAEMLAYGYKAGPSGRPVVVTITDVEAACQRFKAEKGNARSRPTKTRLGRAPYWTHSTPLTWQKYRQWKASRMVNSP